MRVDEWIRLIVYVVVDKASVPQTRGLRGILSSARCEHERREDSIDSKRDKVEKG